MVSVRNLRHFIRQPDLLIFSTIQPIMFVLLFTYVFGGAISHSLPPGVSYIDYLLPGILVQSVTFRASMTAIGLSDDMKLGVIDRFRSMPMARSAVLVGRTGADLVRNVLIIGLMIVVGYIIGFQFRAGVLQALGCIALVTGFGLALSWIFAFIALTVRSAEAAQSAGFVVLFPLVFASSVFVPVSTLPNWLAAIAKVSPVTLTANAARSLALVPGTPSSLGGAIAWIAGLLAVFIPLSVWRYRRMTRGRDLNRSDQAMTAHQMACEAETYVIHLLSPRRPRQPPGLADQPKRRSGGRGGRPVHGDPRLDRRECRAPDDQTRAWLLGAEPLLGPQRLHADVRRVSAARRACRRPARPAATVRGRHRVVLRGLVDMWALSVGGHAAGRAGRAGTGRRDGLAGGLVDHPHHVRRGVRA